MRAISIQRSSSFQTAKTSKTYRVPHGGKNPSCYRRLRLFHPEAAKDFDSEPISLDLDWRSIMRDMAPLWDRKEPFQ